MLVTIRRIGLALLAVAASVCWSTAAYGQSFGVELHNTLMPASGGMGGVSIARPQDVVSGMNANPATLTQFHGTQFMFGGGWTEPTYNMSYDGSVPALNALGLSAYSAKSGAPGAALGNIGITQDLSALGFPATFGLGMISTAGAGVDMRSVPGSAGTTALIQMLVIGPAIGIDVTERLSVGANIGLGTAVMDGPFIGIAAAVPAYGLRGGVGIDYDFTDNTNMGFYYQTSQHFRFDDAVRFPPASNFLDIELELPHNLGLGLANNSLMDGNLLLAMDVLYKQWTNTDLLGALFEDQWVLQAGAQYTMGRVRLRVGYAYAENPIRDNPGASAGGVTPPGAQAAIEYVQAEFAAINRHRVSAGIGIADVLPGIDIDLFAGGMFHESQNFGTHTTADVEGYWLGMGMTWHFGRGACEYGEWTY